MSVEAVAFLACAATARIATAGVPIGLVVQAVAAHRPSLDAADSVALFGASWAISGPLVARVIDHRRSVLAAYRSGLTLFAVAALYISAQADIRSAGAEAAAAITGLAAPLTGSAWSGSARRLVPPGGALRLRAYDVGTYAFAAIAAPISVGVLAAIEGRGAPLATCAGFAGAAVGVSLALRPQPDLDRRSVSTGPPSAPKSFWGRWSPHWPFAALLLMTMGIQPIAIAATLHAPYLSRRIYDAPRAAGLVLATLSIGTLAASLVAHHRVVRRLGLRVIGTAIVVATLLLPIARPGALGALCLLVLGVGNGLLLVAAFDWVDAAYGTHVHSRVFAVAETSRLVASSTASWLLGRIDVSAQRAMVYSAVPICCLLVVSLSLRRTGRSLEPTMGADGS